MDIHQVLSELSTELEQQAGSWKLYICGGAALNLLGISSRQTADIDVLSPVLSEDLKSAANRVSEKLGLQADWLNNGAVDLLNYFDSKWQDRSTLVFSTSNLSVYSLSRIDLLNSKVWAACDRMQDIPDVVAMKPTEEELSEAKEWVLKCDAAEIWPAIVEQCISEINKRLGNENAK